MIPYQIVGGSAAQIRRNHSACGSTCDKYIFTRVQRVKSKVTKPTDYTKKHFDLILIHLQCLHCTSGE